MIMIKMVMFSDNPDKTSKTQSLCFNSRSQVQLKSAVVHETHSNRDKLHHVSKVYFYSVRSVWLILSLNPTAFR